MLKMKFDDLLVSVVVAIVIFFNTLSTTMLNKGIFHMNASTLLLVVLLLALRFWNKIHVSYTYLLFSLALLSIGVLVFVKTGRLNFLVYSLLMSLLISADRKVVLRTYIFVGGSVLVSVLFRTCNIVGEALFGIPLALSILLTLLRTAFIYS